ncbi:MAG: decarboxylating 6-phosphogluconate dehydrogenase [Candidatus Bathyarchaeota archaeon]|nr:decarboxylating 6-phosphogluconate dehydrogenase [Candidatus Bathyarchaeota archaeon]
MKLGIIGLGKMGSNMAERLMRGGHTVVGYARHPETVDRVVTKGAVGAYSLEEMIQKLISPRVIWLMIPAGDPVDNTIQAFLPGLEPGDVIIDGGNSNYKDTLRRAAVLKEKGIHFVDAGTSGGVWGLAEGYCMMIGGEKEVVEQLRPIFETLAPAPNKGWGYVGPSGAGHLVKMVHNGIEYGLMEAYSEGFALLKKKKEFNLDLYEIAEIWRYGSVIRSWLLDLISRALEGDPELSDIEPFVTDSGEGRWTVFEAIDQDVATPVITLSLLQRLRSRDKESFSDRLLAVMREQFGGHAVKRKE